MNILFFSSKPYDKHYFLAAKETSRHDLRFIEASLSIDTINLIDDEQSICVFVNDILDEAVLTRLSTTSVKLIALRCAGYNNVDINTASKLGFTVVNVPAYSPNAVAEHTLCLMLALNRKVHRAYSRVRDGNFSLDGLLGFDFYGKTIGIIGTGRIGSIVARICHAMGMHVLAYDPSANPDIQSLGVNYVDLNNLLSAADVITLHCPLTEATKHMINDQAIAIMKPSVMLINTSRGAILDTCAVLDALKKKKIAYLGLDVYEQEKKLFFEDLSCEIIQDDIFERLLTFPNVLITAHQGFFTEEALNNIATTTLDNISQFENGSAITHQVLA